MTHAVIKLRDCIVGFKDSSMRLPMLVEVGETTRVIDLVVVRDLGIGLREALTQSHHLTALLLV